MSDIDQGPGHGHTTTASRQSTVPHSDQGSQPPASSWRSLKASSKADAESPRGTGCSPMGHLFRQSDQVGPVSGLPWQRRRPTDIDHCQYTATAGGPRSAAGYHLRWRKLSHCQDGWPALSHSHLLQISPSDPRPDAATLNAKWHAPGQTQVMALPGHRNYGRGGSPTDQAGPELPPDHPVKSVAAKSIPS